jgi:hypothetical protein
MEITIQRRLLQEYPGLCSLLNKRAQQDAPPGILEYLINGDIEIAFNCLKIPERYITN